MLVFYNKNQILHIIFSNLMVLNICNILFLKKWFIIINFLLNQYKQR